MKPYAGLEAVHLKGFEPPTISFGSCYSIQLSYKCRSELYYTMISREMQEQKRPDSCLKDGVVV